MKQSNLPRNRPHTRRIQGRNQVLERLGIQVAIGVIGNDDLAPRHRQARVQRRGLALVLGMPDDPCRRSGRQFGRQIRRAIVNHDHFEIGIILCQCPPDRIHNQILLVKSWNQDRNERQMLILRSPHPPNRTARITPSGK